MEQRKILNHSPIFNALNPKKYFRLSTFVFLPFTVLCSFIFISCGIYSFKDTSIDYNKIKTINIKFVENKARYVNPQLSPRLTDNLQRKVSNSTKLVRTNNEDANLVVSSTVTDYSVTTAAITTQQATANRLTITVHVLVKNNVDNKEQEFDVSRNFDFAASLSLQQAETQLQDEILRNLTDEIFNHLFSNW